MKWMLMVALLGTWGYGCSSTVPLKRAARTEEKSVGGFDALLISAACQGDVDQVRERVGAGVDLEVKNPHGDTALTWAVMTGRREAVETLIKAGAKVNNVGGFGQTTLIRAVGRRQEDVVRALLAAGADVNAKDTNGWTALMYAVVSSNGEYRSMREESIKGKRNGYVPSVAVVHLLLEAGADVNIADRSGRTALSLSLEQSEPNTEVSQLLKAAGAGEYSLRTAR